MMLFKMMIRQNSKKLYNSSFASVFMELIQYDAYRLVLVLLNNWNWFKGFDRKSLFSLKLFSVETGGFAGYLTELSWKVIRIIEPQRLWYFSNWHICICKHWLSAWNTGIYYIARRWNTVYLLVQHVKIWLANIDIISHSFYSPVFIKVFQNVKS